LPVGSVAVPAPLNHPVAPVEKKPEEFHEIELEFCIDTLLAFPVKSSQFVPDPE
jgi:hypothetical protein